MKIIFLGTGTSTGVPEIGCQCEVCTSQDKRDWRLRTSAVIETEGKRILIDCGPDFRCRYGEVHVYAEENVAYAIKTRIPYVFAEHKYPGVPNIEMHSISLQPFKAAGIDIIPIRLMHGRLPIVGYRIGRMAYLTDLKVIPESEFSKLEGLDLLVINALRLDSKHPTHAGLDEALTYIERIQPKEAYLIHESHKIGLHAQAEKLRPPHVHLAYDNLQIEF